MHCRQGRRWGTQPSRGGHVGTGQVSKEAVSVGRDLGRVLATASAELQQNGERCLAVPPARPLRVGQLPGGWWAIVSHHVRPTAREQGWVWPGLPLTFQRFPHSLQTTNVVMGSSELRVCTWERILMRGAASPRALSLKSRSPQIAGLPWSHTVGRPPRASQALGPCGWPVLRPPWQPQPSSCQLLPLTRAP